MPEVTSGSVYMSNRFRRLFTEHPQEVGETYLEHMGASLGFCGKLLKLAGCAFIHAIVPGLHKSTVSDAVREMAPGMTRRANEARDERMRNAGVWDVGL